MLAVKYDNITCRKNTKLLKKPDKKLKNHTDFMKNGSNIRNIGTENV